VSGLKASGGGHITERQPPQEGPGCRRR
jgi:hypothetical protein